MMMRKQSMFRAMALGAISLAGLCAFAPTPVTVSDNFNNNSLNQNLWEILSFGGKNVAEVNQRLQFSANGATGLLSFAGLGVEPWGANWRRDFEIEYDYKLNLASVVGDRTVFLGLGLALEGDWPTTFTGLGAGLLRTSEGLFLGWIKFENGVQVDLDGIPITQVSGQVNVEWDRSDDELVIRRGAQSVTYKGLNAEFGAAFGTDPLRIALGCITTNGNISFPGTRVYVDEFQFHGVKRVIN